MKRILFVFLAVAILLVSCAPKAAPAASSNWAQYQNGKPFHFFGTNNNVPVVRVMMAGFWQACQDFGLDCKLMTVAGNDIAGSVALTEQAVALGSSGCVMTMYDQAWYAPAGKAIAAKIPVVNAHFAVDKATVPGLT